MADLTILVNGTPVAVQLGENTAIAAASAATAGVAATAAAGSATAAAGSATAAASSATAAASSAGAAAAAVPAGALSAVNAALPSDRNIFNKATATIGSGIVSTNGTVAAYGPLLATDFIPVIPGGTFTISHALVEPNASFGIAFYDAASTYVSGLGGDRAAGYTATVPAGATQMRLGAPAETIDVLHIVHGSTAPTAYRAFPLTDELTASRLAQKQARNGMPTQVQLFRKGDATPGMILNTANGTPAANANWFVTGFFAVQPLQKIYRNYEDTPGSPSIGNCFYDVNGLYIGCATLANANVLNTTSGSTTVVITAVANPLQFLVPGLPIYSPNLPTNTYIVSGPSHGKAGTYVVSAAATATATGGSVSGGGALANVGMGVPPGATLARFVAPTSQFNGFRLTDTAPAATDAPIGWQDVFDGKPWAGKPVMLDGDSIWAGGAVGGVEPVFHDPFKAMTQCNLILPVSTNGRRMQDADIKGDATTPLASTDFDGSSAFANGGLVLIALGTNDWFNGRTLGAIGDTSASGTFYGDMNRIVIEKLLTWQPKLRIGMCTPLPRFDAGADTGANVGNPLNGTTGLRLSAYRDAIIAFCEKHGLDCLDMFTRSGLNVKTFGTWVLGDLVHPVLPYYPNRYPAQVAKFANGLQ